MTQNCLIASGPWLRSEYDYRRRMAADLLLDVSPDDQVLRHEVADALRPLLSTEDDLLRTQAARIMHRLGHDDEAAKSLYPLLIVSDSDPVHDDAAALKMINETGQAALLLEQVASFVSPPPWTALGACQKIIDQQPLTHADGEALAALTKYDSDKDAFQRRVLRLLFNWLALTLTPGERIVMMP
jgi:hypothetical protein